ncbi:hypothetical protein [Bradyrhizobium sp. SZCCHNRI20481]|uniref:hypothetical protein n=1 Tax=Bradyrhizobium sp. SZCCHNRI20481 TaxID=3057286 RepID=UPI002916653F|nr:hypothetical protein [Bradyrhizobium sp. SZCCHNRI20481]
MSYSYDEILVAQGQRIEAERAQQVAELEAGRMSEDPDRVNDAANRILELDAQYAALAQRANSYYAQGQAHARQANPHGLNDQEMEVAANFSQDPSLSREQKLEIYARQKARYQHMRRTGEYRDDQGTVRR